MSHTPTIEIPEIELAREHFSAEEEVCFPLAEDTVPRDQLLRLGETLAERRGLSHV